MSAVVKSTSPMILCVLKLLVDRLRAYSKCGALHMYMYVLFGARPVWPKLSPCHITFTVITVTIKKKCASGRQCQKLAPLMRCFRTWNAESSLDYHLEARIPVP